MKTSVKLAIGFFIAHSLLVAGVVVMMLGTSDGTQRWVYSLIFRFADFPLAPVQSWIGDNPNIHATIQEILITAISFVFGGAMYAGVGWLIGKVCFDRRHKKT